jgi:hypothetical protein
VLAVACDDQHPPPGEARDDTDERQRVHGQAGADDTRRAGRDKRKSPEHDQVDSVSAQPARSCALASAGGPSCAVPHRHTPRILPLIHSPAILQTSMSDTDEKELAEELAGQS